MNAFALCWKRFGLFGLLGAWLAVMMVLSACQANVDLISEKRILDKIEGSPRCEQDLRVVSGGTGSAIMRVYMVDDSNEEIPPSRLLQTGGTFTVADNLKVRDGTTVVLDAETGRVASGVNVSLTLEAGRQGDDWLQENPNYTRVKERAENLRAPRLLSLLIDMSEGAASQDFTMTRASAPAGWLLSVLNENQQRGSLDVLAVLLMLDNQFLNEAKYNLFLDVPTERQYIGNSGRPRGFVLSTKDEKDEISAALLRLSNNFVNQNAPIYETIENAAGIVRDGSWDDAGDAVNNPAIVALLASRDAHTLDPMNVADKFADAQQQLRGSNDQFIPLMSITYPKSSSATDEEWDAHLNKLCDLARVANSSGGANYFGQLFQIRPDLDINNDPNDLLDLQSAVRDQLDMAFHAMGGWLEVKVNYTLTGGQSGKNYLVAFVLDGNFLGEQTEGKDAREQPRLIFEVKN